MGEIQFDGSRADVPAALDNIDRSADLRLPPRHPLDHTDHRDALKSLEGWWMEGIDMHAENRREQLIDCDYYDHDQIDPETAAVYHERNQAPLVYNLIHPVVDWLVGTERRTRVDWKVHPRNAEDGDVAEVKTKTLKFIADTAGLGFARSKAFKDAIIAGVGWTREFAQVDPQDGPPVAGVHVGWKHMRWDGYSRQDDLSDCRWLMCERYVDLDYAIAAFPDRVEDLRSAATKMIDPGIELMEDDALMPQVFYGIRNNVYRLSGSSSVGRQARPRIRLIEAEYRRPTVERRIRVLMDDYEELRGALFNPEDGEQRDLLSQRRIALDDRMTDRIWHAVFHPGFLCVNEPLPYRHNKFSFTPIWCYRRHRDGMPYGIVRGLRDPQDEYNKRRSKAVFALSTNRTWYEEDAIAEGADEEEFREEVNKPNAMLRVAAGALQNKKVYTENNLDIGQAQLAMTQDARQFVTEGSGVTRENLGLESGAVSGRAILAKQQQGAVTTAEVFDNYRQSIQWSGEKTLSLTEQYMTAPQQIRIVGEKGFEWIGINQPTFDPVSGQVIWQNDITASKAQFVVDQQDYRETVRMAMAEMLMETIARMPPEIGIQLLDLAVDLTDIPNRQEIVQRIRQINGVAASKEPMTPEQEAEQQRQRAAQEQQAQLEADERRSTINRNEAQAEQARAVAREKDIGTKGRAMEVAGLVSAMTPLAPVADRLAPFPDPNTGYVGPPMGDVYGQ